MNLKQNGDRFYSTSGSVRPFAERFLNTKCTPPYNTVEEFVDYWLERWRLKLVPIFDSSSCHYHFKRSIWVELLDLFMTKGHPKYEIMEALLLGSLNRMDLPKINALFKKFNVAENLIAFWLSCMEEYDTWIKINMEDLTIEVNNVDLPQFFRTTPRTKRVSIKPIRIHRDKTLLLFKDVFAKMKIEGMIVRRRKPSALRFSVVVGGNVTPIR
jgi:hypothetical protein